ncbi:isochorismatase [Chlorella sorokiniana]|uniref:Isochorismatase n=1 Tax=Chlorella sorokiniana TaxID=3076 RepID=A0A2P6TKN5_CHLSO|nr:isochorismatase [Chlorella sorokiniana]|eukprot:PRW44598.1 isochorismatase [Chlorella sorokiniana]
MASPAQIKIHRTVIHPARGCCATLCKAMFNVDPSDDNCNMIIEVSHDANVPLTITELPKGKGAVEQKHVVQPGKSYRLIGTWTYLFDDARPFKVSETTSRIQEGEEEARRN